MVANPWVIILSMHVSITGMYFSDSTVTIQKHQRTRSIKQLYSQILYTVHNLLYALVCNPLHSHISASLQGLTTIRVFRKESSFVDQFHHYQNEHSKGWYLYVATSRWFSMRIDFLLLLPHNFVLCCSTASNCEFVFYS